MPILLFGGRQLLKQALGDDVLDTVEVSVSSIAIKQCALGKIFIDLITKMVRFHLVRWVIFHGMKADQIDVHGIQRRIRLEHGCSCLQNIGFGRFCSSSRFS